MSVKYCLLVAIEGVESVGKTVQANLLKTKLEEFKPEVAVFTNPCDESSQTVIKQQVETSNVILDRYVYSECLKRMKTEEFTRETFQKFLFPFQEFIKPDLTVVLQLEEEKLKERNKGKKFNLKKALKQQNNYHLFLGLDNFVILDGDKKPEVLAKEIYKELRKRQFPKQEQTILNGIKYKKATF